MAVDDAELRALAVDLQAAPKIVRSEARAVLARGAMNIKRQLVSEAGRSRHFRIARTISYDFVGAGGALAVEVGPKTGGVGSLAGIAYFGGARGGGGTIPDPKGALEAEAPAVEKYIGDLVEKALG